MILYEVIGGIRIFDVIIGYRDIADEDLRVEMLQLLNIPHYILYSG